MKSLSSDSSYTKIGLGDFSSSKSHTAGVRIHTSGIAIGEQDNIATSIKSRTKISHLTSDAGRHVQHVWSQDYRKTLPFLTKLFWQETWADVGTLRHHFYRVWCFAIPFSIILALASALVLAALAATYALPEACQPDSGFYVGSDAYDIWNPHGLFQITLGFGQFGFSEAKMIDVAWDIVVGRLGQAFIGWISYVVCSKALIRSMETAPVSFGTYEAVTLQTGTFTGTYKLARDCLKNPTLRAKILITWMVISSIFVLSFPTLIGAMSGYAANIDAYVQVDNGDLLKYSSFNLVRYIIHDGDRLGDNFKKDYEVVEGKYKYQSSEVVDPNQDSACTHTAFTMLNADGQVDWSYTLRIEGCNFMWHVSEYASNYGFLGLNDTESTFNNSGTIIPLGSPSLNISMIFWDEDWVDVIREDPQHAEGLYPYGTMWTDPEGKLAFNKSTPLLTNGEFTYTLDELNLRGRCQQSDTSYKWGFSFLVLFLVVLMFVLWCAGMYIVWFHTFLTSQLDVAGRRMGLQRAVLDLSDVMKKDLDGDVDEMTPNHVISRKIRTDLKGGRITYQTLDQKHIPLSRLSSFQFDWQRTKAKAAGNRMVYFGAWARNEWLLFGLFVLAIILLISALAGGNVSLLSAILLTLGSGVALSYSPARKGRWLILLVYIVLVIIFAPLGPFVIVDDGYYDVQWFSGRYA